MNKEGIRIRIPRTQIIFLVVVCGLILLGIVYFFYPKPITSWNYYGHVIGFRADMREAEKIPVYPSEEAVYKELMNSTVENITIAFKPADEKENPYYILEEVEIVQKLYLGYKILGYEPSFNGLPIESYENLSGTRSNPIIALVHPVYSNETLIELKDHVIFVKAKDHKDFDLATIKLIMVALEIETE